MSSRSVSVLALTLVLAPGAARAAEAEGSTELFWHGLNLLLVLGAIVYFGRAPLRSFLAERRQKIEEGIEAARGELAAAEQRLAECNERMASLDRELDEIRRNVRELAERERDRLLAEASAAAERIRRDAAAAVDQELRRAHQQLRDEAAALAVRLAGDLLHGQLTDADRARLADDFVEKVERVSAPDGAAGR